MRRGLEFFIPRNGRIREHAQIKAVDSMLAGLLALRGVVIARGAPKERAQGLDLHNFEREEEIVEHGVAVAARFGVSEIDGREFFTTVYDIGLHQQQEALSKHSLKD